METFEKLVQLDAIRFNKKKDFLSKNKLISIESADIASIELDVDFMNSLILHSDPGYIRMASLNKCRFFDSLINDLLKTAEGKVSNVIVTFTNTKGIKSSAIIPKKVFLEKVVNVECSDTPRLISEFQVKNFSQTLKSSTFETPAGTTQCQTLHWEWLGNEKTPYYCNVYEYLKDAKNRGGNPQDLIQRTEVAKVLEQKMTSHQRAYLENICSNLDDWKRFCSEFLDLSYWQKLVEDKSLRIFANDICVGTSGSANPSEPAFRQCLSRLRKEPDLCLYPPGRRGGLVPQPQCDTLSTALNHSNMRADYQDCPRSSDNHGVTNLGRILLNISGEKLSPFNGPCSTISSGIVMEFNKKFNNDENWELEACFEDRMVQKEKCYKTYIGSYGDSPESYTSVVANILRQTRGADLSLKCVMLDSEDYNPLLLEFKSGCFIIFERKNCFVSECKHKILYNDRTIDFIKLKNKVALEYFPLTVLNERFSQHYLLTKDYRQEGRSINNLTTLNQFFKKNRKGLIHGVGCAEDLLPTFFKVAAMNQCTPLPFIVDGFLTEDGKTTLVTRTGADSLQAPRLISWSNIFSGVKRYQRSHPLRLWTLYGLD